MVDITKALTDGLALVKTDVLSMVEVALPVGLIIMGTFIAVRLGIGFFKSIAR